MQKTHFTFNSFLRYYILKNPEIWLGDIIKNQNFARYEIGGEISTAILVSILDYFQEKLMAKFFKKSKQNLLLGHFGPFLPRFGQKWIFLEKRALSVFRYSNYLSSSQKSAKTVEQFRRTVIL